MDTQWQGSIEISAPVEWNVQVGSNAPYNYRVTVAGEWGDVALGLAVAQKVLVRQL